MRTHVTIVNKYESWSKERYNKYKPACHFFQLFRTHKPLILNYTVESMAWLPLIQKWASVSGVELSRMKLGYQNTPT